MASKRHEGDRACRCHREDAGCAALTVRRLSHERVRELAEEIWMASGSDEPPLGRATSEAALQQRTAEVLETLWRQGYLVLHDLTLPGWPASMDHLVVGPTGVCVIQSWGGLKRRSHRKDHEVPRNR